MDEKPGLGVSNLLSGLLEEEHLQDYLESALKL